MRKSIMREILATMGRVLAIMAISAMGAGFFAGLRATAPNMRHTADSYYASQHLMDVRLISSLGFTEEDVQALAQLDMVQQVMPGYGMDVLADYAQGSEAIRLFTLPEDTSEGNEEYLNRPVLIEGRLPTAADECVVDALTAYEIGDVIEISGDNAEDTLDIIEERSLTVVGRVESPSYISQMRGNTNIGDGRISYYVYTTHQAFNSEAYTEIFLTLKTAQDYSSFSQEYQQLVDTAVVELETFTGERAQIRYNDIYAEASEELQDAQDELAEGRATADEEFAEALQDIQDGEAELADGWRQYNEGLQELADAEQSLIDAQNAMPAALQELQNAQAAYDSGYAAWQVGAQQLDGFNQAIAGLQVMQQGMGAMVAAGAGGVPADTAAFWNTAATAMGTLQQLAGQLSAVGSTAQAAALQVQATNINNAMAASAAAPADASNYASAVSATADAVVLLQQVVAPMQADVNAGAAALQASREQLARGWVAYENGVIDIHNGWLEYNDGIAELQQNYPELLDAQAELDEGRAEYEQQLADTEAEFAEAEQEIADAQTQLSELSAADWYVHTRDDNTGYSGFSSDADRIDAVAVAIPFFFYLVAALVCLTTMTRMVEEQRTQIGTLKALGFKRWQIAFKYIFYAAFASITGGVAGVLIGIFVFPWTIWDAYSMMYSMPPIQQANNIVLAIGSVAISVVATTVSTLAACLSELRSVPAGLMRPKAPKPGKRVLLERISPLWRRMSFMHKVTARNLFRNKKRFIMTIVGVAGCTALLLTGFGLRDSISGIVPRQYNDIEIYDTLVALKDPITELENEELDELWQQYGEGVYIGDTLIDVQTADANSNAMTVYLRVPQDPQALSQALYLNDVGGSGQLQLAGEHAVITEKLADRLGVAVGDTIDVNRLNEEPVELVVGGITENYIYNYVYITPQAHIELFGEAAEYDRLFLTLSEQARPQQDEIIELLIDNEDVAVVLDISTMEEDFEDTFVSLNSVVWLIIASAAMLAFVVLYNLTNINITERTREIATLKVLGFQKHEVAAYVFRENMVLTMIGILVGFVLGIYLHEFVIITAEIDEIMFRRTIEPLSYLWSALFTMLTATLVGTAMRRRLGRINMVESLKSVE